MTAALEGGEWSAARPGRTLSPGKTRYPFYRRLGGPQGRSGRAENLDPGPTELPGPQGVNILRKMQEGILNDRPESKYVHVLQSRPAVKI